MTNGLLVAILFVTLLGMGIAHVVMAMAGVVGGDRGGVPTHCRRSGRCSCS